MKVKVNGKRVSLPFIKLGAGISILKDGYRVILRTNDGRTTHMSLVKNSSNASWAMDTASIIPLNCVFAHRDDDLQFSLHTFYVTGLNKAQTPAVSFTV